MPRAAAIAAALLGVVFATPARAVLLDDLLANGYTVAASTRVVGAWGGCVRDHRLTFADGTAFACARTAGQTGFEPRVTVLRLAGGPPSVVLVGGAVLAGELLRLRQHDYLVPLRMDPDPLPPRPAAPHDVLQPVGAIPSINTVTDGRNAALQQQQDARPLIFHAHH